MKLETERLILREWYKKDIEDLVEGLNNIEVSKWLAFVPHHTEINKELKCVQNRINGIKRMLKF